MRRAENQEVLAALPLAGRASTHSNDETTMVSPQKQIRGPGRALQSVAAGSGEEEGGREEGVFHSRIFGCTVMQITTGYGSSSLRPVEGSLYGLLVCPCS